MAIFDRKSHAPETSEGSESGSILLVRLFFICQATFLSFDILSVAWAERGFGGGLVQIESNGSADVIFISSLARNSIKWRRLE